MTIRTDAHREADERYEEKVKRVVIKFNTTKSSDKMILKHLSLKSDVSNYIKKLIQDDIKLS